MKKRTKTLAARPLSSELVEQMVHESVSTGKSPDHERLQSLISMLVTITKQSHPDTTTVRGSPWARPIPKRLTTCWTCSRETNSNWCWSLEVRFWLTPSLFSPFVTRYHNAGADSLIGANIKDWQSLRHRAALHVFYRYVLLSVFVLRNRQAETNFVAIYQFHRVGHGIPREAPVELAAVLKDFLVHGVVNFKTLVSRL